MTNGQVIRRIEAIFTERNQVHAELMALKRKLDKGFVSYYRERDASYLTDRSASINQLAREMREMLLRLRSLPDRAECDPYTEKSIDLFLARLDGFRADCKEIAVKHGLL